MAKIIAITGIDGSGKTTSARNLQASLSAAGYDAEYQHQFDSIFARVVNSFRRPMESTKHNAATEEAQFAKAKGRPARPSTMKKLAAYLMLTLLAIRANKARFSLRDYLVFDRYFYDDFVRLQQRYGVSEGFFRLLEPMVPRPALLANLEADAQTTYHRQVDVDSSFEKYTEKLGLHRAMIAELERMGLNTISIDTGSADKAQVIARIEAALDEGRSE
ncbi:hypothetical protein N6L26_05890 [Qipengyuania sp. SS22]|uniref:hypothetical protein n=1 Tax=Qipengyuania sp. SS22 TaxID=2979461 RepID=UPI0021E5F31A|nr:hypothetical protein [Qipengyuania sp. SS22]UYH56081.1 hypothetical protein N6L26_05890 [Qipengyuania sp. SS22]